MTNNHGNHICLIFIGDVRFDGRGYNMASSYIRAGHRVSFITTGAESGSLVLDGIDVRMIKLHRWPISKLRFLEFYLKSIFRVVPLKADLYQAEDLYCLPVAWIASRIHGGRLSYDCRELYFALGSLMGRRWTQAFWSLVERIWIGGADLVMITARNQQDILVDRYGIKPPIVVRNHPPLALKPEKSSRLRDEFGISGEQRILLYQGMFHPGRGIFLPLEILRRVPGCVMIYLAYGELEGEVVRRIHEYDLEGRTFIHGPVSYPDLLEYTSGADIGLALQEPFGENHLRARPNKVFEYIMAGVPVIASDFPPLRRAVMDNRVGLVVDVEDMDDVVAKVKTLLNDGKLYGEMVENCGAASREFSWERDESQLMQAISRILD
jgi:glycosyltransferase involved in cell wall biosynthesis